MLGLVDTMAKGGATMVCAYIFASVVAIAAEVLLVTFGILALVPGSPFETRDVAGGVVMLVLAATGLAGFGGALAGGAVGAAVGAPMECCCSCAP